MSFLQAAGIKEQHLKKGHLALAVNEYPQTITTITKGKRDMNTALALKLEKALGLEEGTLMILQVFYDIEQIKKKNKILINPTFKNSGQ